MVVELSKFPITLDSVINVIVPQPKIEDQGGRGRGGAGVQGIKFIADDVVKFDVHVNDEEEALSRPNKAEYAGSLVYLLHKIIFKRKTVTTSLQLGIIDLKDDLGADGDDDIKVTLVPKYVKRPITIRQIKIEFLK
ncbi:polyphenol oxidase latent form, chloroplastic-like [Pyrus x bretschneideri]|uniref:polyphenol oxidase latent form, chloroplastic-like n=1 Tax=Pyrus x bretschneideri TaxID=225117 RepID=UPI00202F49C8|nr:polyphenol oxidase latent form, chloroplastic-like [Pyrus x bretschneideri]